MRHETKNTVEFHYYPAGHAFHNDKDRLGTYDETSAHLAWSRAVAFLHVQNGVAAIFCGHVALLPGSGHADASPGKRAVSTNRRKQGGGRKGRERHHRRNLKENKTLISVVGDPGIEPGMGLPGGVTVRCRTLQHVARRTPRRGGVITDRRRGRQAVKREKTRPRQERLRAAPELAISAVFCATQPEKRGRDAMAEKPQKTKKPTWVIDKERARLTEAVESAERAQEKDS